MVRHSELRDSGQTLISVERNPGRNLTGAELEATELNNVAVRLLQAGDFGSSLVKLKRAIQLNPSDAVAHSNRGTTLVKLGSAYYGKGGVQDARLYFERAIKAFSLAHKIEPTRQNDIENRRQATILKIDTHYTRAAQLNTCCKGDPMIDARAVQLKSMTVPSAISKAADSCCNRTRAALELSKGLALEPQTGHQATPIAIRTLAESVADTNYFGGDWSSAQTALELAIELSSHFLQPPSHALHLPGKTMLMHLYKHHGITLLHTSGGAAALKSFDRSLKIDPHEKAVLMSRGVALHMMLDLKGALSYNNMALAIDPDYNEALLQQGPLLQKTDDHAGAVAVYKKVLATNPADATSLGNNAKSFYQLAVDSEDLEKRKCEGEMKCMSIFRKCVENGKAALAIAPDNVDFLYTVGQALLAVGEGADALATLERAMTLNPTLPQIRHMHTQAYHFEWNRKIKSDLSGRETEPQIGAEAFKDTTTLEGGDTTLGDQFRFIGKPPSMDWTETLMVMILVLLGMVWMKNGRKAILWWTSGTKRG